MAGGTSVGNPSKPRNLARVPSDCRLGSWYPCCKPGPPRVDFCEICSNALVPVPALKQEIIPNRNGTFKSLDFWTTSRGFMGFPLKSHESFEQIVEIQQALPRIFLAKGRGQLHRHKKSLRQRPTPQCPRAATFHKVRESKPSTKHSVVCLGSTCANNTNISKDSKHIKKHHRSPRNEPPGCGSQCLWTLPG